MKLSKKIGVVLSLVHLLVFILFVFYIHMSEDGQVRLLWTLWLPFDFPVSILVTFGFDAISSGSEIGSFLRTWLPYFVHGIVGTIWWYFLPVIVAMLYKKLTNNIRNERFE